MLYCPTIQHSGTHILRKRILRDKGHRGFHIPIGRRLKGDLFYQWIPPDPPVRLNELEGHKVISSLRHPRRVAESWFRRGLDGFYRTWATLMEYYHPHIDVYLHIDHPSRDKDLEAIGLLLNDNFTYDWSKIVPRSEYKTHDIDIDDCEKVPQEFEDFYNETING